MSTTAGSAEFEQVIRREIPGLDVNQAQELAHIVATLVETFKPECIYVFGSNARGDATSDSDIDLLVIVSESNDPGHHRDQVAYRAIGLHTYPVDILVVTREEFNRRATHPASLQATVLREGKLLHAA